MPTIVSVGSITIVDVNDGAPGPAVVVTGNRPLNFTATDGVLDSAQPNIVLTAEVFGLASAAYVWTFLGFETSPVSSGTNIQTITMAQFGTSRAASVTCTVNGLYVSQVTIVRAERSTAEAGATVGATIGTNLSGQITPSNVTTYIANAAFGNAQIGGNLWSTNWNYAGGTGWLLDRSGNFYGNNIYARGDIEASSLKANTAIVNRANIVNAAVDTLQVAGNAITVPIAASGTTSCQTAAVDFGGSPVAVMFTGGAYVSTTNSNVTTGTVSAYLKRNGSVIYTLQCFTATVLNTDPGYFGSAAFTLIDYPGAGSHYYSVEVFKSSGLAATTLTQQQCSVLAIGVKR